MTSDPLAVVRNRRRSVAVGLGVAAVVLPVVLPSFVYDFANVFVYGLLAFSVIVPIGYAGQLIISQGAFFGIGAYTVVKLSQVGVPTVVGIAVAPVVTVLVAYVLGKPATRASGIYLGIITLSFNKLFVIFLDLFPSFTGGSTGLSSPALFPEAATAVVPRDVLFYYLTLLVYVAVLVQVRRLVDSETGWAFLAIKEDVNVAESIGIDSQVYRLRAFAVAGAVCGLAGGLYAPLVGYVSPTMFGLHTTINIMLTGVAGGLMEPVGSLFGAGLVVLLPEVLRWFSDVRLVVYGVLLVLLLMYLPNGIAATLKERLGA